MVDNISQQNLVEPSQVDWDAVGATSKYMAPPEALGPDGKPIVFYGQVADLKQSDPDTYGPDKKPYLNFQIDLKLTKAGSYDGLKIRTWQSTRPFMRKNRETGDLEPVKGNPNGLAQFLKASGLQSKPQTNEEYKAAVSRVNGRLIPFTIDWEARSKDGSETVRGFNSFPIDPTTGRRKTILKAGDVIPVVDNKGVPTGETRTIQSEVLFANARIKYFQDQNRGK